MRPIIIIAAIIAVLLLIALLRVGITLEFSEEGLIVKALAGPVKIQLVPSKQSKHDKKKGKKEKEKNTETKSEKKAGMDIEKIKPAIKTVFASLGRFFSHISIDRLIVRYTVSKNDPADTAMLYGSIHAGAGILQPYLSKFKKIKHSDIRTYADFSQKKDSAYVFVKTTIAIWELIYIVLKLDFKAILAAVK